MLSLGLLLFPGLAGTAAAQVPPPPPPPTPNDAPATILPTPASEADRRATEMEEKLRLLQQSNEEMRRQIELIRQQQEAARAQPPVVVPEPAPVVVAPAAATAPVSTTVLGVPIKFSGAMTLRYDYWHNSDLTDTLTSNYVNNGFLQRIRFGADFGDMKSLLVAGLRLSTNENPNPTIPFVFLGDTFRSAAFGLDQAWIAIRPLNDRSIISLTLGRMPNQTWRGSAGTIRTEMIWDDDVNPAGLALKVKLLDLPQALDFKLENLVAYYQVQATQDQRFVGLTGNTGLFEEQLKASTKYATAALAFYDWENLNNGLSSPGLGVGGVSVQQPTDASLLRSGLNTGNSRLAYGPMSAVGFSSNHFRILNPTVQAHVPFGSDALGNPDVALMFDYAYNFSARKDHRGGFGLTLNTRVGDYEPKSKLNPLNAWVTYRFVRSDVTVAALADSDLGVGTDYKGVEAGVSYRIIKHLMPAISYFDYYGFPLMTNHAQRLFLDVTGEF
ncbi:MAG: hypothetical protein JWP87_4047 [Labilithrix sp.]|nr:hypothetical protein [Labilithrix sp.]